MVITGFSGPNESVVFRSYRSHQKMLESRQVSSKHTLVRLAIVKQLLVGTVLASIASGTGCSSMSASKGWWSSTGSSMYGATTTAAQGVGGAFKSVGTTVSSGFTKAKSAVMTPFGAGKDAVPGDKDDPTSLASLPNKLSPELYVMQGQLAESQGQGDKALESYKKAIEAEPNNVGALVSMARYYDRKGDSKQAIQYFQKAATVSPKDASIHNDLGLAYSKAGNTAAARDSFNKAISINGTDLRYRNNLATLLVENGQADEAVNQLQQLVSPAVAHYNVAYLHFSKQNIPAAQKELQVALQLAPNMPEALRLYEKIGGGQAIAGAQNAYQTASNIYQQVQGIGYGAGVPATTASVPAASNVTQPAWVNTPAGK